MKGTRDRRRLGELKRDGSDKEADELSKKLKEISNKIKDLNSKTF